MERFRRYRDHNNERPFDPPAPVVSLVPVHYEPEMPTPDLRGAVFRDHETLALEAATHVTPLAAYWAMLPWGPSYAASWAAWVKARNQRGWLLYLEELDR